MSKSKRVPRPKDELKREMGEQLEPLRHSCTVFDKGCEAAGKHMALTIRVLVHKHKQSRALLDQLGLRSIRFLDSAGALNPRNLLTSHNLVALQMSGTKAHYVPLIATGGSPVPMRRIPFVNWWNDPVLKDNKRHTFCRRELVLHVADTDGGAHVDPELDEAYMAISRENSLGWMFENGDIVKALDGRPELACMRQLAHELLCTIHQFIPQFSTYAEPVIPAANKPQSVS